MNCPSIPPVAAGLMSEGEHISIAGEPCIWISRNFLDHIALEADAAFPMETGGTFMGWWADPATAVVSALVDAGPGAQHGATHFQPDQEWQLQEIARRYEASGRRETYLGDWHSHPRARSGTLSFIDRGVLRRIIGAPAARCPNPLMMILWGEQSWQMTCWRASLRRGLLWRRLAAEQCRLHGYEDVPGRPRT